MLTKKAQQNIKGNAFDILKKKANAIKNMDLTINYISQAFLNIYTEQSSIATENPTNFGLNDDVIIEKLPSTRISRVHIETNQNQQKPETTQLSEEAEPSCAAYKISAPDNNNGGPDNNYAIDKKAIIHFSGLSCNINVGLLYCVNLAQAKQSDVYYIKYMNTNKVVTKNDIVNYAVNLHSTIQETGKYNNIILHGGSLGGAIATAVALKIQEKEAKLQPQNNKNLPMLVAEHTFANILTTVLFSVPISICTHNIVSMLIFIPLYVVAMASIFIPLIAIFAIISSGIYLPTQKQFNNYNGQKYVLTAVNDKVLPIFKLEGTPETTFTFKYSEHNTCDFKNNTEFEYDYENKLILKQKPSAKL